MCANKQLKLLGKERLTIHDKIYGFTGQLKLPHKNRAHDLIGLRSIHISDIRKKKIIS